MYETLNINKERLLLPDVFKCQDLHDLTTFLLAYHTHLPQPGLLPVPRLQITEQKPGESELLIKFLSSKPTQDLRLPFPNPLLIHNRITCQVSQTLLPSFKPELDLPHTQIRTPPPQQKKPSEVPNPPFYLYPTLRSFLISKANATKLSLNPSLRHWSKFCLRC